MKSLKITFCLFITLIPLILSMHYAQNDFFNSESLNLIRKSYRLSRDLNNNNTLFHLSDRLLAYMKEHDIERSGAERSHYKNIRDKMKKFSPQEDGTYNLVTHEKVSHLKGYEASFCTEWDTYTDEEFDEIVYKLALMTNNNCYIGVYFGIPEISFYFEDLDFAYLVGIMYNQISIWDFGADDEIINPYFVDKGIK